MFTLAKMCAIVSFGILLILPKVHSLVRDAQFVASYHEQSLKSMTTAKAKTPPEMINSVFQCARSCVLDTLCTRYEFCSGKPDPCTLFESGSTCSGDLENDLDVTKCSCFSLKYMKYEDQTCRCSVGYYGDSAQCCQHVIEDCTHGATLPALFDRPEIISFIKPLSYPGKPFEVVCLFNFGGYTTIQKRALYHSDCTDFNRTWEDYRHGFGSMHSCFWLGLDKIYHVLQNNGGNDFKMNIHVKDDTAKTCISSIKYFNIGNEDSNYTAKVESVTTHKNLWCDGMLSSLTPDGRPFTTYDHSFGNRNCSTIYGGSGWWFADDAECSYSNLNVKTSNGNILTIKIHNGLVNIERVVMIIRY